MRKGMSVITVAFSMLGAGCGGSGEATAPPVVKKVAAVEVSPVGLNDLGLNEVRQGDVVSLSAVAKDATGAVIPGKTFAWTTRTPDAVSVSSAGVATIKRGTGFSGLAYVSAATEGVSGEVSLFVYDWTYLETTDALTGGKVALLVRGSAPGDSELVLRCSSGAFDVYVSTGAVTASGNVAYRFNGQTAVSAAWSESTNFRALFAPSPKTFASTIAARDTLIFQYSRFSGGTVTNTFLLRNVNDYMPKLRTLCP